MCVYLSVLLTCFIKQNDDDDDDDDNHEDDATLSIVIIGFTDGCFMLVSSLGSDMC